MADDSDNAAQMRRTKRYFWLFLTFPLVLVAAGFGIRALHLGWTGTVMFVALAAVAMVLLVNGAQRRTRAMGCNSPAQDRYNRRMMVIGIVYMISFMLAIFAQVQLHVAGALLWLAAAAPTLSVIAMIWAMARLIIEEEDEYLRQRIVVQALAGTAGLLAIATIWGFLELFGLAPHAPAWLAVPVFALSMALFALIGKVRT